ncbi:MAG TPA: tetratricopeptide repeat protein [Myxococcota bacterium]|nr:tetratricopeptide repeat protein [Myxococcota bacterium]
MTRALHVALFALALVLALTGAARATELDDALASLRSAVAKYPDDPDVSWALADALEAAGRSAEATEHMQRHLARWPDRPAHGWRALGRCAYGAGRIDEAIPALARALEHDAHDAEAHLYLGLALQQKGETKRAETHFAEAARDPELAPDALLLAGMSQLGRGEGHAGRAQLRRVVDLAPQSDSALDARALLDSYARDRESFRVESYTGVSYDSNATLGNDDSIAGASTAKEDALFEFGTDVFWRPMLVGERQPLELGMRYSRLDYVEQGEYSEQHVRGGFRSETRPHPRLAVRLDGSGGPFFVDDDYYGMDAWLRQSLLFLVGPQAGVLHLYAVGQRDEFEDEPLFESLERDSWSYGAGAEHMLRLGHERDAWLSLGGRWGQRTTDAQKDLLGFEGAYDADLWQGALRASTSLPFEIRARAELFFDAELGHNRNIIDALSEGPDSPARRRDLVWTSTLAFRRPLYRNVELEVHAQFVDRDSNVDVYGYQRAITGLRLRADFP